MSKLLEWNTLQEAAVYLTDETGKKWTPHKVLVVGEKEIFTVHFVLAPGMEAWAGRDEEWVGDLPQLKSADIAALLRDKIISVQRGIHIHPITRESLIK